MTCQLVGVCGGCMHRNMEETAYRELKQNRLEQTMKKVNQPQIKIGKSHFVSDHTRRRANFAFAYKKGKLTLGFNESKSANLVNFESCSLLSPGLNQALPDIRKLVETLCSIKYQIKNGKKFITQNISEGSVFVCEAANGIDLVLEFAGPIMLEHRMALFERAQAMPEIIRISWRTGIADQGEPIIEKAKPYIKIGNYNVYIPAGTFLQPSVAGEELLTGLVLKYLGETTGNIADLFCGVGTFSYVLAANINNKITSVDSSVELLSGFQETINKNMIPNIKLMARNLFKYPLDSRELAGFSAVVIDPPRAGAAAQCAQIAALPEEQKPGKIIFVSCNPDTFVNDANALIGAGYHFDEITMVDQFIYSNHSEVVALFTKA